MIKKPIIVLTGPTAVGKTNLSIILSKAVNGEIISADSMQVYKTMDIGTAKIMPEETQGVKHHLIDILEPSEDFNVYSFKEKAAKAMEDIYQRGHIPMIVGGTGFYIQAVLYDIDFNSEDDNSVIRQELTELAAQKGNHFMHEMLREIDPEAAENIHENNLKRVIRAIEFYKLTGQKISQHNETERQKTSPYNFVYFVLNDDKEKLYGRINKRIDIMLQNGLIEEVKSLLNKDINRSCTSMQAIGYKEVVDYLDGNTSYDEMVEILKRDTRHFAKRQLTWFRREKDVTWVNLNEFSNQEDALKYMLSVIDEKGIK